MPHVPIKNFSPTAKPLGLECAVCGNMNSKKIQCPCCKRWVCFKHRPMLFSLNAYWQCDNCKHAQKAVAQGSGQWANPVKPSSTLPWANAVAAFNPNAVIHSGGNGQTGNSSITGVPSAASQGVGRLTLAEFEDRANCILRLAESDDASEADRLGDELWRDLMIGR